MKRIYIKLVKFHFQNNQLGTANGDRWVFIALQAFYARNSWQCVLYVYLDELFILAYFILFYLFFHNKLENAISKLQMWFEFMKIFLRS